MSNIQTVNLADNINAAIAKINQNFVALGSAGIDSAELTNILDNDYFITVINEDYLKQFNITTMVDFTDVEAKIQANATSLFTIESSITQTDSGITVLAQQLQTTRAELELLQTGGIDSDVLLTAVANANSGLTSRIDATDSGITVLGQQLNETNAALDGLVLGGIDSDVLASAIANANTTLTSRIDATDSDITILAGVVDSVNASLLLFDSATNDRIDLQTNAVSALTTTVTANTSGLSAVVSDMTELEVSLDNFITDGITLTPEQITAALGGATEGLTTRMDADSDKLVVEAAKIVTLDASLKAIDSDTGVAITAESNARSALTSRVEFNEDKIVAYGEDIVDLDAKIDSVDSDTGVSIGAESTARAALTSRVTATEGTVTSQGQDIVTLNQQVDITNSDGSLASAIATATSDLQSKITVVDGRITSSNSSLKTELETKIGTDIASATSGLQTQINDLGGTTSTWNLDLVAGTQSNPHIAGIKFGNDGATAEFALTADTFKIVNASNGEIQPFTVDGNEVLLSNARVTGQLDIGTSETGSHMEITNDIIKIYDGTALRVKLGNLG